MDSHAVWEGAATSVAGGWRTWVSRLRTADGRADWDLRPCRRPTSYELASPGHRSESRRAAAVATQVLVSNNPTTWAGRLASAIQAPIGWRMPWSLADPARRRDHRQRESRVVYLQWGDGRGNWSAVQSKSITVSTPFGANLVPLDPARLLDTRFGNGLSGPFASHVPRSFQVTGRGGVPAGAVAVAGNLTVTGQTSGGYVFLGPTAPVDPTSSTLNFPLGDTRANGVTVKVSVAGKLGAVFVGSGTVQEGPSHLRRHGLHAQRQSECARRLDVGPDRAGPRPRHARPDRPGRPLLPARPPARSASQAASRVPDDAVAVTGNLTVHRPDVSRLRVPRSETGPATRPARH